MRMKKQVKKAKAPTFDAYDAVMIHHYRDPQVFIGNFHLAGIDPSGFTLQQFCELHTRLWSDPTIQARMRSKIDARPKPVFSAVKFLELPFESKYWQNACPDFCAYEVFVEIVNEMTEPEKFQLRARIKKGAV